MLNGHFVKAGNGPTGRGTVTFKRSKLAQVGVLSLLLALGAAAKVQAWGSNADLTRQSTHPFIVVQALATLENDLSAADRSDAAFMAALAKLKAHLADLKVGAVAPDYQAQNYALYQDHFYDPTTGDNYTGRTDGVYAALPYVFETAEYRTRENICQALYYWRLAAQTQGADEAYSKAVQSLGRGMHYFDDLNEPHHASNEISATEELTTYHTAFEKFVDSHLGDAAYGVSTLGSKTNQTAYASLLNESHFGTFLAQLSGNAATVARQSYKSEFTTAKFSSGYTPPSPLMYLTDMDGYVNNYILSYLSVATKTNWNAVAIKNINNAQNNTIKLLYRFLKEVARGVRVSADQPTTLTIAIKTKEDSWLGLHDYGTFDKVYYGVELKDGRVKEFYLGDSFRYGSTNTFTKVLSGDLACNPSDIRKVWVRKQRNLVNVPDSDGDDWYIVAAKVVATSTTGATISYTQNINRWLVGNKGYLSDVAVSGSLVQIPAAAGTVN